MVLQGGKVVWAGRAISIVVSLMFAMSATMKVIGGEEVIKGMAHLGLPESMILPLAILEIACVAIYAVPQTSIMGAILLTGYLGGAICTHWRVGDPLLTPIVLGLFVWIGLYLCDDRLRGVISLRRR